MVKPRMNNPAAPATAHWHLVTTVPLGVVVDLPADHPDQIRHIPGYQGYVAWEGERDQTDSCYSQDAETPRKIIVLPGEWSAATLSTSALNPVVGVTRSEAS